MPKFNSDPIGTSDLLEYLDTSSDFGFELRCLDQLNTLGFTCDHGGSYRDRVTSKVRQFDIRARRKSGRFRLQCAVECKNLVPSRPLLLMCVPRTPDESLHDLLLSYPPGALDKPRDMFQAP